MNATRLLSFSAVAFVLILIPGPSVLFVVGRALSLGRRAALLSVAGNAVGEYVQVLAVAVGIGSLIERSVALLTAVRLAGAAYLVFLGVRAILQRAQITRALHDARPAPSRSRILRDGLVVGATNPKTLAFFLAVLPGFVDPAAAAPTLQLLTLGLVWVAIALISDSAWALVAGQARAWFGRSPRRLEAMGATGGTAMIGLGVYLAVSQQRAS
ncbi:MAG TPA: LysE family translocator [Candidatus Angelobacter sp.]|jgi:threonine/homoserine/homoserine lactone efflux protein|nr:LysE family translocator [Candidatus Angelobacter sp.]